MESKLSLIAMTNKKINEIDKELHNSLFYFVSGFFIVPFPLFIITITVNLIKSPQTISDGIALLYVALLAGGYYIIDGKEGYPFFGKEINSLKDRLIMIFGLVVFIYCFVFFDKELKTILDLIKSWY